MLVSIRICVLEVLVVHANALLTPSGRLKLAQCVVDDKWPLRQAAERFQVSVPTARAGPRGDGRPVVQVEAFATPDSETDGLSKILHLRRKRGWGPARIADKLGLRASTVNRVLRRKGEPLLHELDLATRRDYAARSSATSATPTVSWCTSTSRSLVRPRRWSPHPRPQHRQAERQPGPSGTQARRPSQRLLLPAHCAGRPLPAGVHRGAR